MKTVALVILSAALGAAAGQPPKATPSVVTSSRPRAEVKGVAVDTGGKPLAMIQLLLIRVKLIDLTGEEVTKLPAPGPAMIFEQDDPPGGCKTDAAGAFSFRGVAPALYAIKLKGSKDALFETANHDVAFEVSGDASLDVGSVHVKGK